MNNDKERKKSFMGYQLTYPKSTYIGQSALKDSAQKLKSFGEKALVISGKHVSKTEAFLELIKVLEENQTEYVVHTGITGEPTLSMIEDAAKCYQNNMCDYVIGIGGGSVLDSVKAVVVMNKYGADLTQFAGKEISGPFPGMILIPTTAGTGSEATKFTIITDTQRNVKMLLKGDDLIPDMAIIDPDFTKTSPADITAYTGMDALTHAIEAFTSKKANDYTDLFALSAIKRIFRYLPIAFEQGDHEEARLQMSLAAYEAGICINNASVTLVHGMSRPIGALFHVPHGLSNAMLIHDCLSFAIDGCPEKFGRLGKLIGVADDEMDDKKAAVFFIKALEELCRKLKIPTLAEYGIEREEFESRVKKMSADAIASGSPGNTIRTMTQEDLIKIYKGLW